MQTFEPEVVENIHSEEISVNLNNAQIRDLSSPATSKKRLARSVSPKLKRRSQSKPTTTNNSSKVLTSTVVKRSNAHKNRVQNIHTIHSESDTANNSINIAKNIHSESSYIYGREKNNPFKWSLSPPNQTASRVSYDIRASITEEAKSCDS